MSEIRETTLLVRVKTDGHLCAKRCDFYCGDIEWCRLFLVELSGEYRRCPECLRTFGDETVRRAAK